MQFKIHVKDSRSDWWEEQNRSEVSDLEQAQSFSKFLIKEYNSSLRLHERRRTVIGVEIGGDRKLDHDWEKTNLVTIMSGYSSYDTARCRVCGCEARRFGLGGYTRIGKWRGAKWESCPREKKVKRIIPR